MLGSRKSANPSLNRPASGISGDPEERDRFDHSRLRKPTRSGSIGSGFMRSQITTCEDFARLPVQPATRPPANISSFHRHSAQEKTRSGIKSTEIDRARRPPVGPLAQLPSASVGATRGIPSWRLVKILVASWKTLLLASFGGAIVLYSFCFKESFEIRGVHQVITYSYRADFPPTHWRTHTRALTPFFAFALSFGSSAASS